MRAAGALALGLAILCTLTPHIACDKGGKNNQKGGEDNNKGGGKWKKNVRAATAQDWKVNCKDKDEAFKQTEVIDSVISAGGKLSNQDFKQMWDDYKRQYKKQYRNSWDEDAAANMLWSQLEEVTKINSDPERKYWASPNKFSDNSFAEFQDKMLLKNNPRQGKSKRCKWLQPTMVAAPAVTVKVVDWRASGVVTQVRDQKACSSCWAFAAISAVESAYLLVRGAAASPKEKNIKLSVQQLIDCENSGNGWYSNGCNGGYSDAAIEYIWTLNQTQEQRYPFRGNLDVCNATAAYKGAKGMNIQLGGDVAVVYPPQNSSIELMKAVDIQPVVIYINVQPSLVSYAGGIYTANATECTPNVNHAMVIVGYYWTGTESSSYWILKNSWGSDWGEDGYVRIAFSDPSLPSGPCGMYQFPIAPALQFRSYLDDAVTAVA